MLLSQDFFSRGELRGPGAFNTLSSLPARVPNTLVFAETPHYLAMALSDPFASVVITSSVALSGISISVDKPVVVADAPRQAFWRLHNRLVDAGLLGVRVERHIGINCVIHPTATLAHNVHINDNVKIGPHAVIEAGTIIGADTEIGPGVVIGAEGMQVFLAGEEKLFVRHAGGVRLGGNVHVLANAVISKAVDETYTSVGDETVISLLTSVGHNSLIGRRCGIAGHVLIGGSVKIGDEAWIGPSVAIKDSVTVGARARVLLGSVVIRDVADGAEVSGNFALSHARNMLNYAKAQR